VVKKLELGLYDCFGLQPSVILLLSVPVVVVKPVMIWVMRLLISNKTDFPTFVH